MADTSDNDGLENQGPDPLSYASASDFHAANTTSSDSSPSHHQSTASHHHPHSHSHPYHDGEDDHQQQQQQQQQPQHNNHWTYDDDHSNNNSHYDHTPTNNAAFGSTAGIGGGEMDNGPTVSHHSNTTSTHSNMDNDADSLVGFEDGGTTSPFAYGMESSGHGRLGREGSADGGSTLPLPGADVDNDDDDTADIIDTNKSNSKTSNKSNSNNASKSSKDANNSSSAESTPRRSASASSPRAKSATGSNPPAKMVTSADMSMLDMKTSWDGSATSGGGGGGGGGNKGEDRQEDDATSDGGGDGGGCDGGGGDGSRHDGNGGGDESGVCGGNKAAQSSSAAGAVDFTYTKLKYRAGMLADPAKIAKEREREERVRQARERLEGERKKKLEELREQQRLAQENRERQLEMRRQKIEDLRKRDTERRAAVEERRRMKEEIERLRKESILQKAEERVARYEAWRAGGRKALETAVTNTPNSPSKGNLPGFDGGGTPRHLSVSTSVLYSKRHSDFSSSTTLSPANRPDSTLALDTIREGRRSFVGRGGPNSSTSPCASMSSSFHAGYNSATVPAGLQSSPVRMRDRSSPRKPRPASVGTSMPSFVGAEPAKLMSSASRSKSSDRMARDRSKARPGRRKDKAVAKDAKGKDKKEEAEDEKDGGTHSTTTTKKGRVSLSFFDRLATPKFHRNQDEQKDTSSAKKESPMVRVDNNEEDDDDEKRNDDEIDKYMDDTDTSGSFAKLSPRKAYSTTNLSTIKKKTSFREKSKGDSSSTSSTPRHMTPRRDHSASSPRVSGVSPAPGGIMSKSMSSAISPRVTPPPTSSSPHPPTPSISVSSHQGGGSSAAQAPSSEDGGSATSTSRTGGGGGTNQDISKEEYKAKIAEKRRQARERAEKEAEEERKRQEEERLAEEERMRQEDEEQQRLEEESIRLAAEARKAEGERLERAIEAEEKRKREEAERLEQEKKAKEEADRKAKEEAERMEREKQERAKKEEEERMQRKKKLEMIMKRVKTDPAQDTSQKMDSPVKSTSSSPNRSALASPEVQEMPPFGQEQDNSSGSEDGKQNVVPASTASERNAENSEMTKSMSSDPAPLNPVVRSASSGDILDSAADEDKKEMEKGDSLGCLNTPAKSTNGTGSEPSSTEVKSRFKSPLLQQLVENKGDSPSGTPKFKSPLLQNLLGKTKVGARMGLSASMGDLNLSKGGNAQPQQQESSPLSSLSPAGSSKEISKAGQDEDKDVDESVGSSASSSSGNDQESFKPQSSSPRPHDDDQDHLTNGKSSGSDGDENVYGGRYDDAVVMTKSSPEFSPVGVAMIDSALGSSIEPQQGDALEFSTPSSVMSNGHGAKNMMEDSSIVVQTPEDDVPVPAPIATTFNQFNYQSGQSSSQDETEEEDDDEERRDDGGNGRFEELIDLPYSSANSSGKAAVSPIIAFEENSLRAADVGESMS